jgi:hypothetical protein
LDALFAAGFEHFLILAFFAVTAGALAGLALTGVRSFSANAPDASNVTNPIAKNMGDCFIEKYSSLPL